MKCHSGCLPGESVARWTRQAPPMCLVVAALALVGALALMTGQMAYAAPLVDEPVTVTQPDGTVLHIFASGDEYYNWLHDAEGYTILQDPQTGYYVYASLVAGQLLPTNYIVGRVNPSTTGLAPRLNISPEQMGQVRQAKRRAMTSPLTRGLDLAAPKKGTITKLVVFIRFSDQAEYTTAVATYNGMFNNTTAGANSLRNYYFEVSYNTLTINSNFYPTPPGATSVSYQDSHPRSYYSPYNAATNPGGYNGSTEKREREHTLLREAINYVNGLGQFPGGATIDADNDGYVDSTTFIVQGSADGWSNLLWPHAWSLSTYTVMINGKRVWSYDFELSTVLGTTNAGVLAHEMGHVLGSPDLYHYTDNGISPVSRWDVMASNNNPPQHMTCYMKYRYGTWISSIPSITTPGTYTLNPLTSSSDNCFKIASPNSPTEYYVVEYRYGGGSTFEGSLATYGAAYGLLVYRINSARDGQGNRNGPPDEVYVYRPGGTTSVNGTWSTAAFSSTSARTRINDYYTNPTPFLSTGAPGGLHLCNVTAIGSTISFDYGICSAVSNPAAWDFGSQNVGTSSSAKSFTVTNKNSVPITYGTLSSGKPEFALTNNLCSGQTVAADGICTFQVIFTPSVRGSRNGVVTIPNNVLTVSPDSISLSGTGGGPIPLLLPLIVR